MFRNDRMRSYSQNEKSTRHRIKKPKSYRKVDVSKQTKHSNSKNSKFQKNHKHSKFKCINTISDYLGPDRLTKHVGFLSKGKISDSISRIEKVMSKEVKARAKQDLQEVLKLSHSAKYKHRKNSNSIYESACLEPQSLRSTYKSPVQYLHHKTGFGSNTWKDKLQKSVRADTGNSVLASVHNPQRTSPVKELQLITRRVLLHTVHPFIKQANNLLFPEKSNINKMKNKLRCIRNRLLPITFEETSPSIICENSQVSPNKKEISHTQSSVEDDFQLNPIFTGDVMDQSNFTDIFPTVSEFMHDSENLITDSDTINIPNDLSYSETVSNHAQSSTGGKSSITFVPTSPSTSEDDSPVWKLQLSPAKFVPAVELDSTPTLYFRHKMF